VDREVKKQLGRLRKACLAIPGTEERLSYGAPTWFLQKRVIAMFDDHHERPQALELVGNKKKPAR
jgi:hypothetical protein